MIDPVSSLLVLTGSAGRSSRPLSIPNIPTFVGVPVYTQGAVLDTAGGFLGLASLTPGLLLVIGD